MVNQKVNQKSFFFKKISLSRAVIAIIVIQLAFSANVFGFNTTPSGTAYLTAGAMLMDDFEAYPLGVIPTSPKPPVPFNVNAWGTSGGSSVVSVVTPPSGSGTANGDPSATTTPPSTQALKFYYGTGLGRSAKLAFNAGSIQQDATGIRFWMKANTGLTTGTTPSPIIRIRVYLDTTTNISSNLFIGTYNSTSKVGILNDTLWHQVTLSLKTTAALGGFGTTAGGLTNSLIAALTSINFQAEGPDPQNRDVFWIDNVEVLYGNTTVVNDVTSTNATGTSDNSGKVNLTWTDPVNPHFTTVKVFDSTGTNLLATVAKGVQLAQVQGTVGIASQYLVKTYDDVGNVSTGVLSTAVTPTAGTPIVDITGYTATGSTDGSGQLTITWIDSVDSRVTVVKIFDSSSALTATVNKGVQTATVIGAVGQANTYTLKASDGTNNSAGVQVAATPTDNIPPENVSNVTSSNITTNGTGNISLNWTNPSNSDFASVDIYDQVGQLVMNVVGTPSSVVTNKVVVGKTYNSNIFTIKAKDRNGNSSSGINIDAGIPSNGIDLARKITIDSFEGGHDANFWNLYADSTITNVNSGAITGSNGSADITYPGILKAIGLKIYPGMIPADAKGIKFWVKAIGTNVGTMQPTATLDIRDGNSTVGTGRWLTPNLIVTRNHQFTSQWSQVYVEFINDANNFATRHTSTDSRRTGILPETINEIRLTSTWNGTDNMVISLDDIEIVMPQDSTTKYTVAIPQLTNTGNTIQTQLVAGNTVLVQQALVNCDTTSTQNRVIVSALYDANNNLVQVISSGSLNIEPGQKALQKSQFILPNVNITGFYFKTYVWEGFDTMMPIVKAVILP